MKQQNFNYRVNKDDKHYTIAGIINFPTVAINNFNSSEPITGNINANINLDTFTWNVNTNIENTTKNQVINLKGSGNKLESVINFNDIKFDYNDHKILLNGTINTKEKTDSSLHLQVDDVNFKLKGMLDIKNMILMDHGKYKTT